MTELIVAMLLITFLLLVYAIIRTCFGEGNRLGELRDFNAERRMMLAPARGRIVREAGDPLPCRRRNRSHP